MPSQSPEPAENEDQRVDEVIAAYLRAVRSGEAPSREELLGGHPELAGELAEFFADEDLFDSMAGPLRAMSSSENLPPLSTAESSTRRSDDTPGSTCDIRLESFGDYQLLEEIARGGMGVVYKALQISLSRPVALKMILAGRLASADDMRRFRTEAEAAAHLDHPNIVPIYEVGQHEGRPYFSMRLVEGGDLTQHTARFAKDQRAGARLMAAVSRAVHHAHQRGILHRDLKPRNILIDPAGQPQITDFGLAKRMEEGSDLTQSGAVLGTASYMAPEQARAEKVVTTAVDVYSLGAILYEMLTGRPPFRGRTPAGTILQLLDGEPQRPRAINPKIHRDLETICMKCLEKDPQRRYGSAEALADDLNRWLDGKPISARPVGGPGRLWRWCCRNPALAMVAATAVVVIALLSGFYAWSLLEENRQTRQALFDQQAATRRADVEAAHARQARDQAQDALARSLYEQARALRLSGELDRRWRCFELLGEAERLRSRKREAELPSREGSDGTAELESVLPSVSELRSEAVATALLPGARPLWELKTQFGAQPGLSGDGRLAASLWVSVDSKNIGVVLTDVADRRRLGQWENEGIAGSAFALSPDGKTLASVSSDTALIGLWNLPEGRRIATLDWPRPRGAGDEHAGPGLLLSSEMAFSPDGRYLTAVYRSPLPKDFNLDELTEIFARPAGKKDREQMKPFLGEMIQTIVLWNLEEGAGAQPLETTVQDTNRGGGVFSPNGKLLAFPAGDSTVRLWSLQTGRKSAEMELPLPLVGKIAFDCAAERLACPCSSSAAHRGAVVIWNLAENVEQARLETDFALTASTPAFSPDGSRLALGTSSGRIVLFDLARGRETVRLKAAHTGMVALLRWDHDRRHLLSWGVEGAFKRWELADRPASDIQTGRETFGFAFSPDGQWLACGGGPAGKVDLKDRATGSVVRTFSGYSFPLPGLLLFSPNSQRLAQVGAYQTVVWDVNTGREAARLEERTGLAGRIDSVAFTDDGTLLASVASTREPKLAVWDVARRREIWRASDEALHRAHLAPGGRLLVGLSPPGSAATARMTVFEIPAGRTIAQAELPGAPFGQQTFSPDGRWLVTADMPRPLPGAMWTPLPDGAVQPSDLGVILQAFPAGDRQLKIAGASAPTAYAFSPDGGLLAVGYQDGSIKLWDVAESEEIVRADFCSHPVTQLAFTPDGASLAITDGKSPIQRLDLTALRRQLAGIGLDW